MNRPNLGIDQMNARCYILRMGCYLRSALAVICLSLLTIASPGAAQALPRPLVPRAPPAPPPPPGPPAPIGSMVRLISSDDYPEAAIDALEQGAVTVGLAVTPEGRVGACQIVRSSGSVALDTATCRILTRRARFRPARDATGRVVADRVEQRIRWDLDSLPFESLAAISIGRTNALGAIRYCYDHTLALWCADPQFDLSSMAVALTKEIPVATDLVRTMSFTPGAQRTPRVAGVTQSGDRQLYSGSARVGLSRNGKVTDCVETARSGGTAGALCELARSWLFKIDPDDDETRSGVWNITLASRLPAAVQESTIP